VRDPQPAQAILAEAVQLKAELEEALPQLSRAERGEAHRLIGQLQETIEQLGAALAIIAGLEDPPAEDRVRG
jgi:hypothetical protein